MAGSVQIWSYNYAPEPTGIAPVSATLAESLSGRGWDVEVVAAHPHYPDPLWGRCRRPYREIRDGIRVTRLPLWVGRQSASARMRQEASFTAALTAALPFIGRAEAMIVASPSFPALAAAVINARLRRTPWVLWVHDLLPDGAVASGLLDEESTAVRLSRKLETTAYASADRIAVLSKPFGDSLRSRGVPDRKIELIYDPATRGIPASVEARDVATAPPRVLSMGNIGFTQGLAPMVAAFERSAQMQQLAATLAITGNGVAADEVRNEVVSDRVEILGLVSDDRLESELRGAMLALVSQSYDGTEFNLPSKLMNFMAYGLPIIAAVNPGGEVARIVEEAGAGWVADSSNPDSFPQAVAAAQGDPGELERRGAAARGYAEEHFSIDAFGGAFERLLENMIGPGR